MPRDWPAILTKDRDWVQDFLKNPVIYPGRIIVLPDDAVLLYVNGPEEKTEPELEHALQ